LLEIIKSGHFLPTRALEFSVSPRLPCLPRIPRVPFHPTFYKPSSLIRFSSCTDFKNGLTINLDGVPNKIIEFSHSKQARGAASTNARFKNLVNGSTLSKTIKASESFDPAVIDRVDAQHTYAENDNYYFMDVESFEEIIVQASVVDEYRNWMTEGMNLQLVKFGDLVIDFVLPSKMDLEIVETEPTYTGNKSANTKPAVSEFAWIEYLLLFQFVVY